MTTTVVLRCVVEHTEALPSVIALSLVRAALQRWDVVESVVVAEVMRREGDLYGAEQSPLTDFIGGYFRERGRPHEGAKRELAAATAAICPQAETPGGPHVYLAQAEVAGITNTACVKCGLPRPR